MSLVCRFDIGPDSPGLNSTFERLNVKIAASIAPPAIV